MRIRLDDVVKGDLLRLDSGMRTSLDTDRVWAIVDDIDVSHYEVRVAMLGKILRRRFYKMVTIERMVRPVPFGQYELEERLKLYRMGIEAFRDGAFICSCMTIVPNGLSCPSCRYKVVRKKSKSDSIPNDRVQCDVCNAFTSNRRFCSMKCNNIWRAARKEERKISYPQPKRKFVDRTTERVYISNVTVTN